MSNENNKNQLSVVKNNYLTKVSNTLSITNKLLKEIDNREPSDDFRVAIPDVNFQRYLSEKLGIDVTEGTVAYVDVKNVTKIDCKLSLIESLIGIEYFISLIILNCIFNKLTNLDLTKNTALTNLSCGANQLTNLDVTKNKTLTSLECGFNQLTSLDVTKNTALIELNCYANQITHLDITKNMALNELNCSENKITHLDITKNKALSKLDYSNNPIIEIKK